jgi:hypothetical protein
MNTKQKWFVLICVALGLALGSLVAQQQFSGGQAVTVTSGSITAVQPTGSNLHVAVDSAPTTAVTLAALPSLVAGTAKIGVAYPYTGCGTTTFESGSPAGFAALAATTTTVASATTCVLTFVVTNTGAASFTYYATDNASTPIPVIGSSGNPITILPGERDEYTFPNGSKFNAGIKLTASATTGSYYLLGVQ